MKRPNSDADYLYIPNSVTDDIFIEHRFYCRMRNVQVTLFQNVIQF